MKKLLGYLLMAIPVGFFVVSMFLHGVSKYGLINTVLSWSGFALGAAMLFLGVYLTEPGD